MVSGILSTLTDIDLLIPIADGLFLSNFTVNDHVAAADYCQLSFFLRSSPKRQNRE